MSLIRFPAVDHLTSLYNVNSVHFFCRWKSTSNATTEEQKSDDAKNAITKYYLYLVNGVSQRVNNLMDSTFIGSARANQILIGSEGVNQTLIGTEGAHQILIGSARANQILIRSEGVNQTLIVYAGANQIL